MTHSTSVRPETVLDALRAHFDVPDGTSAETGFDSLDLDSLALIELAVILTKRYGVEMTGEEVAAAGTVAKVAELVSAKAATG
ncbi:acyl carrier protein [Actinacidiphila rubida]|uniref:Acyl carrier protein n=1 Tax=Actinacidiphila rubida TaxID=310780 RepID=A0A1H8E830_9ACTN|nr:acyl carrier protein [Actinacidiphila rubida]SEN15560.1 acyl carrier protein [Actinacidiphila rubida]